MERNNLLSKENLSAKVQEELDKGRDVDPSEMSLVPPSASGLDRPFMMPLLPVPNLDTSNSKASIVLSGTARRGVTGPAVGAVDIGVGKNAYFFRVALPGVRQDPGLFLLYP